MESKTIFVTKLEKILDIRAKVVAKSIFDFHLESELFCHFDTKEKLEILSEKVYTLKTKFQDKHYAQLVAKYVVWFIDEYVEEHQLCPDCFTGLKYQTIYKPTYYQPESGCLVCNNCGYQEAM